MPLSIAESGHPTRCGFGKSWDRPLLSRSNIRFSSALNSSCCFRTHLLKKLKSSSQTNAKVYRERSMQTNIRNAAVT
jgi:hypothetical protein